MMQAGTPIRVLVTDDAAPVRAALANLLSEHPRIEVVGEAGDGEQAVRLVSELHPDVVLMDVRMPVLDGLAASRRLLELDPELRIVMLSVQSDPAIVAEAAEIGVACYLTKGAPVPRVIDAVLGED